MVATGAPAARGGSQVHVTTLSDDRPPNEYIPCYRRHTSSSHLHFGSKRKFFEAKYIRRC